MVKTHTNLTVMHNRYTTKSLAGLTRQNRSMTTRAYTACHQSDIVLIFLLHIKNMYQHY